MLGLYAVLPTALRGFSESLTTARLRPVEREPVPQLPAQT